MFNCFFCKGEFKDIDMFLSNGGGEECCIDCINEDGRDNFYSCVYCDEDVLYDDLTYNDDGNECHQECLYDYENENAH